MRTIVEEHVVSANIDQAIVKHPRLEDVYQGIQWRLSREPQNGYQLPGATPETYLFKITTPLPTYPTITLLYRYTVEEVTVLNIRFS